MSPPGGAPHETLPAKREQGRDLESRAERAILEEFRGTLPAILIAIGGLYLASSFSVFWLLDGVALWLMLGAAVVVSGGLLVLGLIGRKRPLPARAAYPVAAASAAALLGLGFLFTYITQEVDSGANNLIILVGVALLLPSPRWVAAVLIYSAVAWPAAAAAAGASMEVALATAAGSPLVMAVSYVRTGTLRRMHVSRIEAEERGQTADIAEGRFRHMVEAAPDGMVIVGADGNIELVNPQAERMFGYDRSELIGRPVELLMPEAMRAPHIGHRQSFTDAPSTRAMGTGRDLKALRKNGEEFPVEISLSPLHSEDGRVVTAVIRDITARREAEAADRVLFEKNQELDKLKELNQLRTQLLNTAAHEINTPLTPLRLQLHMLASGRLGGLAPEQERAVSVLQRNVERLSTLTADILDVARLESGRLKVEPVAMSAHAAIADVVGAFEQTAVECGVDLSWDAPADLGVLADPDRLAQVLLNLVGNAIKFTPAQGFIHISATRHGDDIRFVVEDSGVGLSATQIERLFQPFSQVQEGEDQAPGGTGLGLYIAKGLVEAHGGTIGVESGGRGKGATFHFMLHRAADFVAAPAEAAPRPVQQARPDRVATNDDLARRLRELI